MTTTEVVPDGAMLERTARLAANDPEFTLLAATWAGSIALTMDDSSWTVTAGDGTVRLASGAGPGAAFRVSGPPATWQRLLSDPPPPGHIDFCETARFDPAFAVDPQPGDAQSYLLLRRLSELMRHARNGTDPAPRPVRRPAPAPGTHESRVGRYVHLELDGADNAVYYEESGTGIPLLCQHTAGSDARQWRHVLEDPRVTSCYRVIAYDLPGHGKSLPPESTAWWTEEYLLTTALAMAVPMGLVAALGLDGPVFMGSSVGGMLALDLARWHPETFRAVIALEAGLKVPRGDVADARLRRGRFADPALYAAQMWGAMAPTAPEAFRHETRLHYAQGAPTVFSGDSHYYLLDHDLSAEAGAIDTTACPVYLLTGEYDWLTVPMTREAADRIAGSRARIMTGLGHFPMSEDHEQLMRYVLPVLDEIARG